MNRFKLGLVGPITLLLAVGCSSDPTSNLRNGLDHINAAPSQLFVQPGSSKTVEVSGVDAQGNPLDLAFEATAASSAITVRRDSTFHPVYVNDTLLAVPPTATRWRFIVTAIGNANTSFTVKSGGDSVVVPVQVVPESQIDATFDNDSPALGAVVTLTAPSGTTFADTAQLLIGGDPTRPLTIVARAADGSSISFIPPPNVASPITITSVSSVGAPTLTFSPATATVLTTPVFDSVDVTFSTATPTIGQTVTASIPNPLIKFDTTTASQDTVPVLTFVGQFTGPAPGPAAVTLAADSSSLTFQAPPNANGPAAVVAFTFPGGYAIPLPTKTGIATTPVLADTADITVSNATPNVLEPITITLPGSLKFAATGDSVVFTGLSAIIQSVNGGGSSITVIPLPGSTGQPRLVGVFPTGFPQFSLAIPGDDSVTVPAITPLEGTGDPATAPSLTIPTAGNSVVVNDAGAFEGPGDCCFGFTARFYKLTIAAPTTLTFTLDWFEGQDLGVYITQADGITVIDSGDAGGEGPTGHPESVTVVFAAGTYFAAIPNFSASNPSVFQLTIHNP